jgi:hypothetical protein
MLCSPVFIESESRLFVSGPDAAVFHPFSSSAVLVNPIGLLPRIHRVLKVDRTDELSRLESAVTQNPPITHLESAFTKSLNLKSFIIRTSEERWGRGGIC